MTHCEPATGASPDSARVNNDGMAQKLLGGTETTATRQTERRAARIERRHRSLWSVWYGGFKPRRRAPPRRGDDLRFQVIDWYSAHLLAVSLGILIASATDAFLTINLLMGGADEVNPVMALLVYRSAWVFTAVKMSITGASVLLMVFLARYRFMRLFKVELVLYAVLVGYMTLIGYELWLLNSTSDTPLL
jgi:Domain of unknown function (DUF5658)